MKDKKWFKKILLLVFCMMLASNITAFASTVAQSANATPASDIKGHWAEPQIMNWIDKGFIKGYEDGSFKPDNTITRAEFMALINRTFGFTAKADITFNDLASTNWAYNEAAIAVKAAYITGYADGTIRANMPISRQEAAVIVSRLLKLKTTASVDGFIFGDKSQFASWSKDSIGEVVAEQIMKGYADDTFKPEASITRAEAVVTLDRANSVRANATQTMTYNASGSYGPATGVETVNKNVIVNAAGVTLQNMVINGDLILGEGIGNGDAFLENVKVTGKVTVKGGGENSIHFNNSVLVDIIIDKKSGTGIVRIVSEGTTTVALVVINSPATLKETNSTGTGFGNVNLSSSLPAGSKVTLAGSFNTVNVSSQQIQVDVPEGTIKNVNANSTATGMSLNLNEGATINSLVLDAAVKMLGKGTIVLATMNTGGSTFETPATTTATATPAPTATPTAAPTAATPPQQVVVTKTALTTAITTATTLLSAHAVGAANGNVSQGTHNTYNNATAAATTIKDAASSTQSQVDAAIATLATATAAFNAAIIVVTTTALTTVITTATTLLGAHAVGAANGNVSQDTHDSYNSAIATATTIRDAASSSQSQVDTAIATLDTATSSYNAAIIVVTTTALTTAITAATTLLGAHAVGAANGNVSQGTHDSYNSAIIAATAIRNAASSTQAEVDAAIVTLATATSAFNAAIIVVTTTALSAAITNATTLLGAHTVGVAYGNVSQGTHDTYNSAIIAMTAIRNAASSIQAEVDTAITTLASATLAFEEAFIIPVPTIVVDGTLSNYMPVISIGNLINSSNTITAYDTDGTVIGSGISTDTTLTLELDALTPGTHTIKIKSVNQADNVTVYSNSLDYLVNAITILPKNQISESQAHMAVLATNGQVYTWGYNYAGQIGDGTMDPHITRYPVPGLPNNIVAVQAGEGHTTVLTLDGHIWKWGSYSPGITLVNGIDHVVSISSEGSSIAALKSDGTVWIFNSYTSPSKVANLDHVIAIKDEWSNVFVALKSDGTVWSWGDNDNGQLGDGTGVPKNTPVQVTGLPFIIDIKNGNQHTLALSSTGTVYAWGFNIFGQVGDGTTVNKLEPYEVIGLSNIVLIGAGNYSSFAKDQDGNLYSWGYNGDGQLGLGNSDNYSTPTLVNSSLTNVVAITGGEGNTTIALLNTGEIMTWGSGSYGMLGNENQNGSTTPGLVANFNLTIDPLTP